MQQEHLKDYVWMRRAGEAISRVFSAIDLGNQVYVSRINPHGVHVIEGKGGK